LLLIARPILTVADYNPNHGPVEDQVRTAILQVLIVRNYSQGELIMKARDSELAMTSEEQRNPTAQAWHAAIASTIKNTQAMATSKLTMGSTELGQREQYNKLTRVS
jgi:hypothetical protein